MVNEPGKKTIRTGEETINGRILMVDDELEPLGPLIQVLGRAGYEVLTAEDDNTALYLFDERQPDVVILDIGFGYNERKGLDILKKIRQKDETIDIILLTGLSDPQLPTDGFGRGADHFIRKSESPDYILALVARCLRRAKPEVLIIDDYIMIDRRNGSVQKKMNGAWKNVHLKPKEFQLLDKLVSNCGRVVLREVLEDSLFRNAQNPTGTLNKHISVLRKKIELDPKKPGYIILKQGIGYWFNGC
jgi:DNA-binding response OmpR family regulator